MLDLLAMEDTSLPSYSCVLPYTVCKAMSADTFLISVAALATLELLASGRTFWYAIMHLIVVMTIARGAAGRESDKTSEAERGHAQMQRQGGTRRDGQGRQ